MCGIVGKVQRGFPIDLVCFQKQCDALRHRGPDDAGVWCSQEQSVALGSRRLAIQDLSPAGHMPMSAASGKVWIVFNGEIYNFHVLRQHLQNTGGPFRSGTDTEVLLHAYLKWGTDCVRHINGMFAFALYDEREPGEATLFLARDRAGEKPLYYWHHTAGFACASELKALMVDPAFPRKLDLQALDALFTYGFVPGEMCILQGVKKLPPAHAMRYDFRTQNIQIWRYWNLPTAVSAQQTETSEPLIEQLEALLETSVRDRLVADVPVGILLSGGIDSSLVTALAARSSSAPIKTFTITFPGHSGYDESVHARKVADYFATAHHELIAEPTTVDLLPTLAAYCDEPLADSSLLPTYLVSRLTREHVTVALGGDGGDELFGGYQHYSLALRQHAFRKFMPARLAYHLSQTIAHLPVGLKGRNYLLMLLQHSRYQGTRVFDATARRNLFAPDLRPLIAASSAGQCLQLQHAFQNGEDLVERLSRADFTAYLPDDILVKVDRASMAVSLEVRAPFLDQAILEFAFGKVPSRLKATKQERKILLRHLARRILPPDLDLNRKQGFSLPLAAWFKGGWGNFVAGILSEADPALFSPQMIQRLLVDQQRGFANTTRLFALTFFELWRRTYRVSL